MVRVGSSVETKRWDGSLQKNRSPSKVGATKMLLMKLSNRRCCCCWRSFGCFRSSRWRISWWAGKRWLDLTSTVRCWKVLRRCAALVRQRCYYEERRRNTERIVYWTQRTIFFRPVRCLCVERETDRQAGKQTARQSQIQRQAGSQAEAESEIDRQTESQAGRQAGRQTGRHTERQTDRQTTR